MMKIDAVITWVDGNDPVHRAKRRSIADTGLLHSDDVAGDTRFTDVGEIYWCVASLNRFAPWINRIYIVTDGQDPHLEPFLERNFPDGYIPVEIVDHKVIFRGYEQYLPTFNSAAIESMTWRIPGLSDYFIELNDDMLLTSMAVPGDFFTPEGHPVCYADRCNMLWTKFTRSLKSRRNGREKVTFKGTMCNAASLSGSFWSFLKINHTPRALLRTFYQEYFEKHPEHLLRNIRHQLRNSDMYNPQLLQYTLLSRTGECVVKPVKGNLFYLQPKPKRDYVYNKLKLLEESACRFCCFNSIDKASEDELSAVKRWVENRLDIVL